MFFPLRQDSNSAAFKMFAGECESRTGNTLKCLDVDVHRIGYVAVDAMVEDNPQLPLIPYTLYFCQGDEAAEIAELLDMHGLEVWLSTLFGATEFFTEAQKQ